MKFLILTCAGKSPAWLSDVTGDYCKKISFWIPCELRVLASPSMGREAQAQKLKIENEKLLEVLRADDYVILFDERGKSLSTREFSAKLENILGGGKKRLVCVVGGAYGVGDALKKRADLKLSLSGFTMTHQLALALVCEQFYRAMTLIKGTAYHNE